MYCKCGAIVHPKRVEILKKVGYPVRCTDCSDVQRVAGYNPRGHKGLGDLVVVSQETADAYYSASRRNGIVSSGVKFRK